MIPHRANWKIVWILSCHWLLFAVSGFAEQAASVFEKRELSPSQLIEIFVANHHGWSLDEVLLSDERRQLIVNAAKKIDATIDEKLLWEGLVRLRKAGKLKIETTQRATTDYGAALPAAEIAARKMQDELAVSFDQILVDSKLLKEYDKLAREIDAHSENYILRKAALRLRKSCQLKPELVTRVTDWKREIVTWPIEVAKRNIDGIPSRPGVYIFRDATGYLYIGQSNNLRERLGKHLIESDRVSLAKYLANQSDKAITLEFHIFGKGSPAEETIVREAYESELIRSRKPKLNLAP